MISIQSPRPAVAEVQRWFVRSDRKTGAKTLGRSEQLQFPLESFLKNSL